jgi:two-component system nitrate/nitrite response regulator NarL
MSSVQGHTVMTEAIRVAVVDDHPMFRAGVVSSIRQNGVIEVIAEGDSIHSACRIAEISTPDVMLLDISMHGSSFAALPEIRRLSPRTKVVMLTASESEDDVIAAFKSGARGFVVKGTGATELVRVIDTVHAGDTYITPTLASRLLAGPRGSSAATVTETVLTQRELEVLKSVALGKTNKEIARLYSLSEKTVKHHMTSIMEKIHVRNRVEAALFVAQTEHKFQN